MNKTELEACLQWLRVEFYRPDAGVMFDRERKLLLLAITFPADWFKQFDYVYPARHYKRLIWTIFKDIKRHQKVAVLRTPGRYLLQCMQDHMKRHGDRYHAEGKAFRNDVARQATALIEGLRISDTTVDHLAAIRAEVQSLVKAEARPPRPAYQKPVHRK
jgi:hypothetical protein